MNRFELKWATVVGVLAVTQVAAAHISLERGGTHLSRFGDGQNDLKEGPCGRAGVVNQRGTHIYTYAPGQTITVTFSEYIPHPGYFRFAFDTDGDDDFVDPVSILPIDPNRGCPYTPSEAANDKCNASDFYNNDTVLPGMDNLDPHLSSVLSPAKTWTYQVTLPNVECANCTLQLIQVMEDPLGHGPFDGVADIYHQCIDIVLTNGGGSGGSGGAGGNAGVGAGGAGGDGGGGVSGTGGAGGVAGDGSAGMAGDGAGAIGGASGTGAGVGGASGVGAGGTGAGGTGGTTKKKSSGCNVAGDPSLVAMFGPLLAFGALVGRRRSRR